jgi:hypothetical protein
MFSASKTHDSADQLFSIVATKLTLSLQENIKFIFVSLDHFIEDSCDYISKINLKRKIEYFLKIDKFKEQILLSQLNLNE